MTAMEGWCARLQGRTGALPRHRYKRLPEQAGALAHKLKSSSRPVGALALGELCAGMEQSGKAGDMAALAMLLPRFEQELVSVEDFLGGIEPGKSDRRLLSAPG